MHLMQHQTKIAILGAGSSGTAFASLLLSHGYKAILWARRPEVVEEINLQQSNNRYLPGVDLDPNIRSTTSLVEALHQAQIVILAVPSHAMRELLEKIKPYLNNEIILVSLAKGLEDKSLKRMSEIAVDILGSQVKFAVISGPSHAEEIVANLPTSVVMAANQDGLAQQLSLFFSLQYYKIDIEDDLLGVELAAAFKNMIALATGCLRGLGYGDNAQAALITNGFDEIRRLCLAMGANDKTLLGLAGLGDLIVTCTSEHSRNFRAGYMLGQGLSLDESLCRLRMVVEGVRATKAAYVLSGRYGVELPIAHDLYDILYNNASASILLQSCMNIFKI